jgi:plastocyanin
MTPGVAIRRITPSGSRTAPNTWSVDQARRRSLHTVAAALVVPVVAVVTVAVTLSATPTTSGSASGSAGPPGRALEIRNFAYSPTPLVAKAGSTITVANDDGTVHTLTADDKSFDSGNLEGGARTTIELGAPGTYTYHCDVHNYMTGKIVVR